MLLKKKRFCIAEEASKVTEERFTGEKVFGVA